MTEEILTQAMLDRPMEYAVMERYLAALADTYALPVQTIGTSVSGRAIRALALGDPRLRENADKASYAALYVGGAEEGDWVSTAICLRFLRDYCVFRAENRRLYGVHLPYLWENRTIYVIPCLHPDGMYTAKRSQSLLPRPQSLSIRESFLPGMPLSRTDGAMTPPETAAAGETREARLAGDCAASRTVTSPMTTPQTMPTGLTANRGKSANSPPMAHFKRAHNPHVTTTAAAMPMGMAILHQFSASSRTKRIICRLLAPMQRSMPKNFVRCATLLFMLLEIMSTPAVSTRKNKNISGI